MCLTKVKTVIILRYVTMDNITLMFFSIHLAYQSVYVLIYPVNSYFDVVSIKALLDILILNQT